MSQTTGLGELEVVLVLAILHLTEHGSEAYGSVVKGEVERRTGRDMPRGSIYVTLDRLEDKGLLSSTEGAVSAARGQRPKRLFTVTPQGLKAVKHSLSVLSRMQRGLEGVLGTAR